MPQHPSYSIQPGTVYLVGAGPGDAGLLTRAGADALAGADVVVYDRLVNIELLELCRPEAERIYVGKAPAQHTRSQQEINALLAEHAQQGKCVCRLKGGDPFVFGRGGEEAAYLKERGITVMVVPGVTSAIAAPAYAGIPLTDRRCASSFAVITGHEEAEKEVSSLDWAGIAHGADTLVFLMGLAKLPFIAAQLQEHGKPPTTPAAVIMEGTLPAQRVVTGTLADIAERAQQAGLHAPAITVVGEVVTLRETLAWFDTRPLFGRRILVTRARAQASELAHLLALAGATPVEFPVIRIVPLPPPDNLLERLRQADWLVFTSANGLPNLLHQLAVLESDIRALGHAHLAAIGPATAQSLWQHGLRVDFIPQQFIAEDLAAEFPTPEFKHIVIVRAQEARETLSELLAARGAGIDILPVYHTAPEESEPPELSTIDAITFTSSSTVRNFRARFPGEIHGPRIASIGPVTSATARELGLQVDIEAEEYTIPALVKALVRYFDS